MKAVAWRTIHAYAAAERHVRAGASSEVVEVSSGKRCWTVHLVEREEGLMGRADQVGTAGDPAVAFGHSDFGLEEDMGLAWAEEE
jgi:hypothetical protein